MKNNLYLLQLIEHSEKQIGRGKITEKRDVLPTWRKNILKKNISQGIKIKNGKSLNIR